MKEERSQEEVKRISIKLDSYSDRQVRKLSKSKNIPVTEVVTTAARNELDRECYHSTSARTVMARIDDGIEKMIRKKVSGKEIGLKEIEALGKEFGKLWERIL